ncbi:AAA family ATPase [Shewanella colwelliana]|uniref:AAA family ATPase n=1 Tax=Shewanella colwelliana TaxID=23 RepID=UPI00049084B2|nr:AAA family ATPase [Shewanella colwelliana]
MRKILVFGNSGSGKSTLAKRLCQTEALAHLDLDTLAWQATMPPQRQPIEQSQAAINHFTDSHENWVIEGCYSDLLQLLLDKATEIVFMDLPIEQCINNAKNRPWEPHKYASPADQDANLDMLIQWIRQYENRQDSFSRQAHRMLYHRFSGIKQLKDSNDNTY